MTGNNQLDRIDRCWLGASAGDLVNGSKTGIDLSLEDKELVILGTE
jgi:hypothetical protein